MNNLFAQALALTGLPSVSIETEMGETRFASKSLRLPQAVLKQLPHILGRADSFQHGSRVVRVGFTTDEEGKVHVFEIETKPYGLGFLHQWSQWLRCEDPIVQMSLLDTVSVTIGGYRESDDHLWSSIVLSFSSIEEFLALLHSKEGEYLREKQLIIRYVHNPDITHILRFEKLVSPMSIGESDKRILTCVDRSVMIMEEYSKVAIDEFCKENDGSFVKPVLSPRCYGLHSLPKMLKADDRKDAKNSCPAVVQKKYVTQHNNHYWVFRVYLYLKDGQWIIPEVCGFLMRGPKDVVHGGDKTLFFLLTK